MSTSTPPNRSASDLDLGRGLRFVVEDPDWIKKMLIGGAFALLSVFIVGGVFIAGYVVRLIRRTVAGEARPLPDWDDLGGLFNEGLRPFGVLFGHVLAVMAAPALLGCVLGLSTAAMSSATHGGAAGDAAGAAAGMVFMMLYALMALASLALFLYLPAALARFASTDRMSDAFDVRENVAWIRANIRNYAMALLLYFIAHFASQFGFLLCCIGLFPASFWSMCVLGWGLGEVLRLEQGAVDVDVTPRTPTAV